MIHQRLAKLESAIDLHEMSAGELQHLGNEIRDVLCNLLSDRSAHFASNLGVVELCLALHSVFDFRRDRLIWDTGHQSLSAQAAHGTLSLSSAPCAPRADLMGYPNPARKRIRLVHDGPCRGPVFRPCPGLAQRG